MIESLILYSLMFFFVVLSIGKTRSLKNFVKKIGFKKIKLRKEICIAILFIFLLIAVSIIIEICLSLAGLQSDLEKVPSILKQIQFFDLLIILTVASFVEEIFFRGFLQRKTNILFASFVFAYFHIIYGSFSELIGTFFLGLVLGKEYEKTKNLFAPILSHFFYNIITLILIFTIPV